MAVLPDLHSLDTAAARLDQQASELRARLTRLQAASGSVGWHSAGAAAFQRRSDTVCRQLYQCAQNLEHAAFALRRHAATARDRLQVGEQVVEGALSLVGL